MSCGERDVCRLSRRASARVEVLCTNEDTLSTLRGLVASIVPTFAFARVARSRSAVGCGPWVGLREPAWIEHGHIHAVHGRTPVCDATRYTLVCAVLDGRHARPTRYTHRAPHLRRLNVRSWQRRRGLRVARQPRQPPLLLLVRTHGGGHLRSALAAC